MRNLVFALALAGSAVPAFAVVAAYVARRTRVFARQPRAEIERFSDACPQTDG